MKEADWYEKLHDEKVRCLLCPHHCTLHDNQSGICRSRINRNGTLYSENYGKVSAIHLDPIEKKPLYHFFPGKSILSIGTVGCNLQCRFCQNCEISQVSPEEADFLQDYDGESILSLAIAAKNNIGVAYTYNEPAIWFEFVMEVAGYVKSAGLRNVMVTNGFIDEGPLDALNEVMDAYSIDLKSFDESFYRTITSSRLKPITKTIKKVRNSGKHLELVNLVIPGLNDDPARFEEMVRWIHAELGKETILHLSAYYPRYKATEPPTPVSTLRRLSEIANRYLSYVYTGNIPDGNNHTICPDCKNTLVIRKGYQTVNQGVDKSGACKKCGKIVFQNF